MLKEEECAYMHIEHLEQKHRLEGKTSRSSTAEIRYLRSIEGTRSSGKN
jgi:hypothetical protein